MIKEEKIFNTHEYLDFGDVKEVDLLSEEIPEDYLLFDTFESFGEYDGSISTFLKKAHIYYLTIWDLEFPGYEKELLENKTYREDSDKNTILHHIAKYFHEIDKVMNSDTRFPFELLEKKGTFTLKNYRGKTPFHYMCENADWQGTGPTMYLQTQIEKYIVKNYPDFNLSDAYFDCDEDKLYYARVQDRILAHINRSNAEKFIESIV